MRFLTNPDNQPLNRPGAYLVRNLKNGKCYIGISQNVARRLTEHARATGPGLLARAVRKHGPESFLAEPLLYALNGTATLPEAEAGLIAVWGGIAHGYNVQAASGAVGPYGERFSAAVRAAHARPETKERLKAANQARANTDEGKAHMQKMLALFRSPQCRQKAVAAMKATRGSADARQATSLRIKAACAAPGFLERRVASYRLTIATPESMARRSLAAKARMSDPDVRKRVSDSNKATMATPEFKAKRSAKMLEIHSRPEVKEKHRASSAAANARPDVRAKFAASRKGRVWITNGKQNRSVYPVGDYLPVGWRKGMFK